MPLGPFSCVQGKMLADFHALKLIFMEDVTEAVIFVDGTNAFINLNQQVTLLNCRAIDPSMFPRLTNTYHNEFWMFAYGQCIKFKEGKTQGDAFGQHC